jgi:hypothetical protein
MKQFIVPKDYTLDIKDQGLFNEQQQDPAWYVSGYGSTLLATLTHKNGYGANVYCVGEMRYEWGEFSLRYSSAILKETNYTTDKQLNEAIDKGDIVVENNAWFESVFFDTDKKEWWDFNDSVAFDLDEAIKLAIELVDWTLSDFKENGVSA